MQKILIGWIFLGVVIFGGLAYFKFFQNQGLTRQPISLAEVESVFLPGANQPALTTKVLFGGDLMFDRNIRLKTQQQGVDFVLAPLADTFAEYDVVIANLEGPVTDNPSRSVGSQVGSTNNYIFTFDPSILPMLKRHRFHVINLGNNHILNFGVDGVAQTKSYLEANQIQFFGDTSTETEPAQRVAVYQVHGLKLGLVNYNEFVADGYEHALADLDSIQSQADVIVVYAHWGAEYQPRANQVIQNQAHEFIDQGADLVIGSHPHVVQQMEEYQGKRIYYSLGNFVFDQYFSPEVQQGLLVGVEIMLDRMLQFTELPITIKPSGQTSL